MEVAHHDRTTAARRTGNGGSTLVFVHGSGGTNAVWKAQLARLSSDFEVVALDLSGHGDSENVTTDSGPETLAAYAEDVISVARATDADVLVGNSLGGAVVQQILVERKFAPTAAILVGTGPHLPVGEELLDWLDSDFDRAVEFLHGPDLLFHDPDERTRRLSMESMNGVGQAVTRRDFRTCNTFDVRNRLGTIEVPTLAITGAHDQLTPPGYHEVLAEEIPKCQRGTIPDAAHLSMLERPRRFNELLLEFLGDVL